MIKRLRIRFVCNNMFIVTVMLLVIFGMVFHFTRTNLEEQSIRMLQRITDGPMQQGRPGGPEDVRLPYFVVTVDRQGKIVSADGEYFDMSDGEQIAKMVQRAWSAQERTGILKEYNLRYCKNNTPFGEKIAFADVSGERSVLSGLVKICAFIGLISFSVFLLISFQLARWAIRPVEKAWNQQRQFVADASHELKTPLTVIMTNAELLREPEYGEEERRQFVGSILTMSRQMRGLVESLLDLARVDNGSMQMVLSQVDFSELTAEALLPFEPVYFEKSLVLESSIAQGLRVKGSREHLQQVVDILLDNAAKYALPGGTVSLQLRQQGKHCLLSISNPGQELSREELKNIFKRFYRIDKARSMNRSYGLGLAIAESIVLEHGGKIWAESKGGMNTFFVQLSVI